MRVAYEVSLARPEQHLLGIEVVLRDLPEGPLDVRMPEWVPGHYGLMNNARFVQDLEARAGDRRLRVRKTDKQTWRIARGEAKTVTITYDLFARTLSSSACLLDDTQCHINGGNAFLYVAGHQDAPCTLALRDKPRDWKVATALERRGARWHAPTYDDLIDSPVKIGRFHHETFRVGGKEHHVVLSDLGDTVDRLPRFVKDTKRFVTFFRKMFGSLPYEAYWFLCDLHPTRCKGGALEHQASTHLALPLRLDAEDEDDYLRILAVMAHEYFHLWNVKRIRPQGLGPFDYTREAHTPDLWVAEGFTEYYAWYALLRAGAIDARTYFRWLARYIDGLHDQPGRRSMSLREASWETWNQAFWQARHSFETTNARNRFVNYYVKGAVVGALLDVGLRSETGGEKGLEDVFRALWGEAERPEGFAPGRVEREVEAIGGARLRRDLERWTGATSELPYRRLFQAAGLTFRWASPTREEDKAKHRRKIIGSLGLEVDDGEEPLRVAGVDPDSPAAAGGVLADDRLLAVDGWRLTKDDWRRRLGSLEADRETTLAVFRHDRLLTCTVVPQRDRRRVARFALPEDAPSETRAVREGWLGEDVAPFTTTPEEEGAAKGAGGA